MSKKPNQPDHAYEEQPDIQPPQHQDRQPGIESEMEPQPYPEEKDYKPAGKLKGKVALITGGDSGIGRATAIAFAKEGADMVISYLDEHKDAEETKNRVEEIGQKAVLIPGHVGDRSHCQRLIDDTINEFGKLDILVNNAAEQHPKDGLEEIDLDDMEQTFQTNIFSMFYLTKAALPHLKEGSSIINTTSVVAYRGNPGLIDYSATKGAVTSFTRSMAVSLAKKGIRVNGVAPGPVWTPLIPATFDEDHVDKFGGNTEMDRPGQPAELAPAYVYLASEDSSFMSGQVLHLNGGMVVNG
ncbi:SDR family oxidoreductase [Thalassorhabdus alkalitolerans]|uniref:SDR family oxidoreductase n=1 Tax=Thalassorhabdus alkalitolerans TaxID=2282697 RepID=A0ABW0YQK5_9BACI